MQRGFIGSNLHRKGRTMPRGWHCGSTPSTFRIQSSSSSKATHDSRFTQEPTAAQEPHERERSCGVKEDVEECGGTSRSTILGLSTTTSQPQVHVRGKASLTEKPNRSKLLLVMTTARRALEKIHATTSLVRKLLYESSNVFFSSSLGAT
jgi:hypothetical protein